MISEATDQKDQPTNIYRLDLRLMLATLPLIGIKALSFDVNGATIASIIAFGIAHIIYMGDIKSLDQQGISPQQIWWPYLKEGWFPFIIAGITVIPAIFTENFVKTLFTNISFITYWLFLMEFVFYNMDVTRIPENIHYIEQDNDITWTYKYVWDIKWLYISLGLINELLLNPFIIHHYPPVTFGIIIMLVLGFIFYEIGGYLLIQLLLTMTIIGLKIENHIVNILSYILTIGALILVLFKYTGSSKR